MNFIELLKVNLKIASLYLQGYQVETSDFRRSYKYLASSYDDEWFVYLRSITEDVLSKISGQKPKYILDLGCGTGGATLKLKNMFPEAQIIGMDCSKHMLRQARPKLGCDKVLFFRDTMERGITKLSDSQFDLITCAWSLGYARHKKVYKELYRVLSKNGYLLALTNKRDTLKAVQKTMKYTMCYHYKSLKKLPLHKFPENKEYLLKKFGKRFKEIDYGEGNFSIDLTNKQSILDWLLNTGILAGYEYVLDFKNDKKCRKTFEDYIKSNFKDVTHEYMWILLQKQ